MNYTLSFIIHEKYSHINVRLHLAFPSINLLKLNLGYQLVQAVIPPQHVLRAFFYTNRRKGVKMIFK